MLIIYQNNTYVNENIDRATFFFLRSIPFLVDIFCGSGSPMRLFFSPAEDKI